MRIFSKRFKRNFVAITLSALLTSGGAWAQDGSKEAVGKVIDIDGPQLKTNRLADGNRWYQAYPSMTTYFKERLEAGPKTSATVAFFVGGRAVVSPGTRVEVLSKDLIKVESGTVWAKFDPDELKGQGKKFSIQTSGGVMGIEGTEFIVTTDPVTKKTQLVVVEGTVDVNGNKVTTGKEANFGNKAVDVAEYVAYNTPESAIRDAAFGRLDPSTSSVLRPAVDQALWYVPGRYRMFSYFYGREFWIARNVLWAIRDPKSAVISTATSYVPVGGGFLNSMLNSATKPAEPPSEPRFADGKFRWKESKRSDKYAVIVANDSESKDVVWYGLTQGKKTEINYPTYGPELTAGQTYYVTVASLDGEGKVRGNENGTLTVQSSFVSNGHAPKYGNVAGVDTIAASESPPSTNWQAFKGANAYRVLFKSGEEILWSADTQGTRYSYPAEARAFDPGEYQVVVEAFDSTGIKMAESQPNVFATSGWTPVGLEGPERAKEGARLETESPAGVDANGPVVSGF